jgi:hypothetical protein
MPSLTKPVRVAISLILTVIKAVLVTLVREAIELGSNLAHLGNDQLLIRTPTVGRLIEESTLEVHVKTSRAGQWHFIVENVRKFDDLSGLDELDGLQDRRRLDVISRAAFITGAPFRWAAILLKGG